MTKKFSFSPRKENDSVEEVSSNLCKLFSPPELSSTNESLVGKRIRHRWTDVNGTEQWFLGRVLSIVPGTDDWFNVEYDNESDVLSLNLMEDIEKGDLEFV